MKIEIISIGTEILLGDVVDTNAAYLARNLTELGYDINYMNTVGDNKSRIVNTIQRCLERADILITTGGLGPTTDDITRSAVAESMDCPLYTDDNLVKMIKDYFAERNYELTPNNLRQAQLPRGAEPLINNRGTAPGILLEKEDKVVISLPGVPREMKDIFQNQVFPYLKNLSGETIKSRVLKFFRIGESSLETELEDIFVSQTNPTLALLADRGEVKLRITAKAESQEACEKMISRAEEKIRDRVGKYIYTTDNTNLPELVGEGLTDRGQTIALAESCTGGLIGNRITDIPGSSDYFLGGIIAYSNRIKENILGVKRESLEKYGAVSKQVAREMAVGIRKNYDSDFGLSVTGIAGPGGGTEEKPVGLVYVSVAFPGGINSYQLNLEGNRLKNKWMTSQYALYYTYEVLQE
ncbi:MAG: competence/damage-inducible protein A [bacterium]